MTDSKPQTTSDQKQRKPGLRGHVAGIVALLALLVIAVAWFWSTLQPPQPDTSTAVPNAIIVVGAGTFLAALLAEIRAMNFWEVLEFVWELILGALALVGAMLKTLWKGFLGLFGLD